MNADFVCPHNDKNVFTYVVTKLGYLFSWCPLIQLACLIRAFNMVKNMILAGSSTFRHYTVGCPLSNAPIVMYIETRSDKFELKIFELSRAESSLGISIFELKPSWLYVHQ